MFWFNKYLNKIKIFRYFCKGFCFRYFIKNIADYNSTDRYLLFSHKYTEYKKSKTKNIDIYLV